MNNCPVCGSSRTRMMLNLGEKPLSVSKLRSNPVDSFWLPKYKIEIFMCRECSHVFNARFDPEVDQYSEGGCTMYNNGDAWQQHMRTVADEINEVAQDKEIQGFVEIGAGDGSFLDLLRNDRFKTAWEPSEPDVKILERKGYNVYPHYFYPGTSTVPDDSMIIMRHVLEHIHNPREFLERLSDTNGDLSSGKRAVCRNGRAHLYIEVPNIRLALENYRLEDWTYEHCNHFTPESLEFVLAVSGWRIYSLYEAYNSEVLCAFAYTEGREDEASEYIRRFTKTLIEGAYEAKQSLDKAEAQGSRVVFWGAAGKSINTLGYFHKEGRPVVDSDLRKKGLYVPGTKIKIQHPNDFEFKDTDLIFVTTNWRYHDIYEEIERRGIKHQAILHFTEGELRRNV